MLKPIITAAICADGHDPFYGSIGIKIPADIQALDRTCIIEANNIVNLASACLWEGCSLAAPRIRDIFIDVTVETDIHSFQFEFNVLPNDATYEKWSPELHDSIEKAKRRFFAVLSDMIYDLAIDYYGLDAERRANHAYTICRRN